MVLIGTFVAVGTRRVLGAREAVLVGYAAVASGAGCGCTAWPAAQGSCCQPSSLCLDEPYAAAPIGITSDQPSTIPEEISGPYLGCGNPLAAATLRRGEAVLDIGSGAGPEAFQAARLVGPQGRVIGQDMTPAMIERARRTALAARLPQVEFRLGQAEAMPIEADSMDVILSNCVINLCEG